MPEIGTSGLMSGDGKRGVGHRPQAAAPILDSTDEDLVEGKRPSGPTNDASQFDRYGRAVGSGTIHAAQYLRMSSENQRYSTENQQNAIAEYAEQHGYTVVASYIDAGKSGLSLKGR
ncbi:MAG: recombinase family protein, partial [Bradyrhizobium sp.]